MNDRQIIMSAAINPILGRGKIENNIRFEGVVEVFLKALQRVTVISFLLWNMEEDIVGPYVCFLNQLYFSLESF